MRTDELDYDLPPSAIAQVPLEPRDAARLLVDRGPDAAPEHRHVRDLPDLLREGDLLVVNDTRVLSARVPVVRSTGGGGEVLLLEERDDGWWEVLCRPARKLRPGDVVDAATGGAAAGGLSFEVGEDVGDGRKCVGSLKELGNIPGECLVDVEAAGDVLGGGGVGADGVIEPDEGVPELPNGLPAFLFKRVGQRTHPY